MFNNVLDFACQYQSNFKEEGQYEKHENIQSQKECDGLFDMIARICFRWWSCAEYLSAFHLSVSVNAKARSLK